MAISVPRLLLGGVRSGVGKTLLSLGLAYELRKRNLGVSACIVGANLLQATVLRRTTARFVRCFDGSLLAPGQVMLGLAQAQLGADIVIIDGHGGLYDGSSPGSVRGADAEFAAQTKTPVVLVVDARGFGSSLAAVVRGLAEFGEGFILPGTILNYVSLAEGCDVRNLEYFSAAFEAAQLPAPLGGLPDLGPAAAALPPSGFTERENLTSLPRQFFVDLAQAVSRCVDVEAIVSAARTAVPIEVHDGGLQPTPRRTRIGVADDACFNVCFQDNLDLLRFYGAEIVPFSPLADEELPSKIGGVYLPGGCLPEYGEDVARNTKLLEALREFANGGGVVYSEGAGTAYLCREFVTAPGGRALPGVGLIPGAANLGEESFGYCESTSLDESILGRAGVMLKGISTGGWRVKVEERIMRVLRTVRTGSAPEMEGLSPGAQIVAATGFYHFGSNPSVARNIVDACEVVQGI